MKRKEQKNMKSIKSLALTLLSVGMLAGCGSSGGPTTWSDKDKATMQDNLYGVVLPYINKANLTVNWDATRSMVVIAGDTVVGTELADYAAKYTAADGWEDQTDLYNVTVKGSFYAFEKEVETENGTRYVSAQISALNDKGAAATEGQLQIIALDPYMYEFPAEDLKTVIDSYFDTQYGVPAFEADRYEMSGTTNVLCYTSSTTAEADYTTTLTTAEFIVLDELDEDGYHQAASPDKTFGIYYRFIPQLGALHIALGYAPVIPSPEWPAEEIATAFETYADDGAVAFDFPALTGEGLTYAGAEDPNNALYVAFGMTEYVNYIVTVFGATETTFTGYIDTLKENGWATTTDEYDTYATLTKEFEAGKATLEVKYDAENGNVEIYVYLFVELPLLAEWPADEIDASFDFWYSDSIPAFEGESVDELIVGYKFDKGTISVMVTPGQEAAALEAYDAIVKEAGWTVDSVDESDGSTIYNSPNNEFQINPYVYDGEGSGEIVVYVIMPVYNTFPAELVALISEELLIETAIPAFDIGEHEGEFDIHFYMDEWALQISVSVYDDLDEGEDLIANYQAALVEAGYEYSYDDDYGDKHYVAEDGTDICVWEWYGQYVIDILPPLE